MYDGRRRALRRGAGCGRRRGIMQSALRLLDRDQMDKQRALDAALGQIERAFGKGSIMKLGSREAATDDRGRSPPARSASTSPSASAATRAAASSRSTARSRAARPRSTLHAIAEGPARRRHGAFIDAEHALDVSYAREARGQDRRSAGLAARLRRAGARDRRHAGPLRRRRRRGHRLGRRAGAAGRARGRDGRQPTWGCRPG